MIDEETKQVVRVVVSSDTRPWRPLSDLFGGRYIEIDLPESAATEAQAVAQAARDLGLDVLEGEPLAKSFGAEVQKVIELLIDYAPKVFTVASGVKSVLEIPDTLRKLREKIGPYLGKTRDFAPQLQLPVVAGWLDRTYGPKKWKVDSLRVQVKVIGKTLVFLVPESTTRKTHLLVLVGDDVEELPQDLLPKK